jgi:F-BAR domain only protein
VRFSGICSAADHRSIFQVPWQRIVSGIENSAASHERLAQKIESDVEKPLRQFQTRDSEMKAATGSQSNLVSMAKDLSAAQKKAEKARGGKKEGGAASGVDDASRQWESQAPYIFEQLQALDEKRVNHLRDVLTQLQTHEADQVERNRASAESCLNALLNLETADEIRTFMEKVNTGRANLQRRRSSIPTSRPPTSSMLSPPEPPPSRPTNSRRGSSTSGQGQDQLSSLPEPTPSKSKLGGLKRLGTVMGRRKSTMPPPPTPEKKKDRRSFAPFRRGDSSRSFQDLEESGRDLTPVPSQVREDHGSINQIPSAETAPRETQPSQPTIDTSTPLVNGSSFQPPPGPPPSHIAAANSTAAPPETIPEDPTSSIQASPIEQPLPPPPIQQQLTGASTEESSRAFAIRDQPIKEDESEAQMAMSNMANQLRMQGQTSGINRVQGSVRGRRDVRNTMFIPAGVDILNTGAAIPPAQSPPLPVSTSSNDLASPIQRPPQRAILEDHALASDTTSIHSSHSLLGLAHHPELHEPGLNTSLVETVNTWFSPNGVTKSFVTGEVALAYNATPIPTPDTETVRLSHFELLEKVAANPTFVTAAAKDVSTTAEDHAGTYTVSLANIKRSTPTVGLKYQLHIDEDNLAAYSPILVTPAWQLIDGQASVIVLYSLNPAFASSASNSASTPVLAKNVIISVSLDVSGADAPKPSAALMSPNAGASFRRKTAAVTWKFAELALKSEQERLLVRFTTGAGVPRKGSVELKFEMPGRGASEVGVVRRVVGGGGKKSAGAGGEGADPFADDDGASLEGVESAKWEDVPGKRAVVSGRYTAS